MLKTTNTKGFTLVELLIVIVVIAILAAISIVAYNGIQNRAKTTSGNELASQVAKKIEALNAVSGSYFTGTGSGIDAAAINTAANSANAPEAVIDDTSTVKAATSATAGAVSGDNGEVVAVWGCADGAVVQYWDFASSPAGVKTVTAGEGC